MAWYWWARAVQDGNDGLAFVASQGVPERDLVAKKQYS